MIAQFFAASTVHSTLKNQQILKLFFENITKFFVNNGIVYVDYVSPGNELLLFSWP